MAGENCWRPLPALPGAGLGQNRLRECEDVGCSDLPSRGTERHVELAPARFHPASSRCSMRIACCNQESHPTQQHRTGRDLTDSKSSYDGRQVLFLHFAVLTAAERWIRRRQDGGMTRRRRRPRTRSATHPSFEPLEETDRKWRRKVSLSKGNLVVPARRALASRIRVVGRQSGKIDTDNERTILHRYIPGPNTPAGVEKTKYDDKDGARGPFEVDKRSLDSVGAVETYDNPQESDGKLGSPSWSQESGWGTRRRLHFGRR